MVSQLDLVLLSSFVVNASFSSVFPYSFEYISFKDIPALLNMSLRNYLARYKSTLAYNNMVKLERADYEGNCCGSDDADIVVIGLLLLVSALLTYLLLAATVSSGRRRKRELISSDMLDSTSFTSNSLLINKLL